MATPGSSTASTVQYLVYRYLSQAEFFNIYKPSGTEAKGGGQGYIDFPTSAVSRADWLAFFSRPAIAKLEAHKRGPGWLVPIHSLGLTGSIETSIYQRRQASFSITRQRLTSRGQRRVLAWHPDNGFPVPSDPMNRQSLKCRTVVYLCRLSDGTTWAGWMSDHTHSFMRNRDEAPPKTHPLYALVSPDNSYDSAGFIDLTNENVLLDKLSVDWPFLLESSSTLKRTTTAPTQPKSTVGTPAAPRTPRGIESNIASGIQSRKSLDALTAALFGEDTDIGPKTSEEEKRRLVKISSRDRKLVEDLKSLYDNTCQITGRRFTFMKRDGVHYTEAHHLIPIGKGGFDHPLNMIVVSAHVHRMLHYAEVKGIDLGLIKRKKNGEGRLIISINGTPYEISWRPDHLNCILSARRRVASDEGE